MRAWIMAIVIGCAAPAAADTCADEASPPESAGCAVRPGMGALTSLALSVVTLGLATRRSRTR